MPDIPILQHYDAFGVRRKHNVHSGVDLYVPNGEPVYAVEDGIVVYSGWFTGSKCDTPWWNNTRALYVEGDTATIIYGEIQEMEGIKKGTHIEQGRYIGNVVAVLKEDKGKPTSMLHFATKQRGYDALYDKGVYLMNLDPTLLLIQCKLNSLNM
jgi:hypothetical protein